MPTKGAAENDDSRHHRHIPRVDGRHVASHRVHQGVRRRSATRYLDPVLGAQGRDETWDPADVDVIIANPPNPSRNHTTLVIEHAATYDWWALRTSLAPRPRGQQRWHALSWNIYLMILCCTV